MLYESPFPLLRLPSTAVSEVLKIVNPKELINLSFCSRKTWNFIKTYRDKSVDWEIELIGWHRPEIQLTHRKRSPHAVAAPRFRNYQEDSQGSLTVHDFTLPSAFTSWNKEVYIDRFKAFGKYLACLFDKPICKIIGKWQDEHAICWVQSPWEEAETIDEEEMVICYEDKVLKIGDFAIPISVRKGKTTPHFPLFRLPVVVLSEFLKVASPCEVINLSLCSQKAKKIVKTWRNKAIDWEIELTGFDSPTVRLVQDIRVELLSAMSIINTIESSEILEIGGYEVPVEMKFDCLVTLWKEDGGREGFKLIVDYVSDFFEKPVHQVWLQWENRWMIEWINGRQTERLRDGTIENLNGVPVTDEDYSQLIETFTPTRSLWLQTEHLDTFHYPRRFRDVDDLYINNGLWVTMNNLLGMNSISITIDASNLTVSDMNVYIKHWLNGGNPRLKFAELRIWSDGNLEQLLEGLKEKVVEVPRIRQYRTPYGELKTFSGYDIQREDGVTATFDSGLMVVWPDLEGNHN